MSPNFTWPECSSLTIQNNTVKNLFTNKCQAYQVNFPSIDETIHILQKLAMWRILKFSAHSIDDSHTSSWQRKQQLYGHYSHRLCRWQPRSPAKSYRPFHFNLSLLPHPFSGTSCITLRRFPRPQLQIGLAAKITCSRIHKECRCSLISYEQRCKPRRPPIRSECIIVSVTMINGLTSLFIWGHCMCFVKAWCQIINSQGTLFECRYQQETAAGFITEANRIQNTDMYRAICFKNCQENLFENSTSCLLSTILCISLVFYKQQRKQCSSEKYSQPTSDIKSNHHVP